MLKTFISTLMSVGILISAGYAADYMYPSVNPPANLKPSKVPQYVCLMWDDNSYTGLKGTTYEDQPNMVWDSINRVEGDTYQFKTWHSKKNTLGLKEGDIGVSWVVRNLLPTGNNPDGTKRTMGFHVIAGQMAAVTWKKAWVEDPQPGDVWGWRKQHYITTDWSDPSLKKTILAPVCWGREYAVFTNNGADQEEENFITRMYKEILTKGFEIGSHTLDHMETNSGLRKQFWPNSGEGYDPGIGKDVDLNGTTIKEQTTVWDSIGWEYLAPCKISKECWKGALELAETELKDTLSLEVGKNLYGFRAPRLESNSNMLLALKERGYIYDCSIEETNMRGGTDKFRHTRHEDNFFVGGYWPYTFDNGSPSQWYVQDAGDGVNKVTGKPLFEQYPTGLWEIPTQVFVVPEDIRSQVWDRAKQISQNSPEGDSIEAKESWVKHGRITGFDFNLFILWGMTKADFVKTMQHNLDLNMEGSKAPFIFGLHCDYFTPMYDNATLLSDYNKSSYGLSVTNGWNTWKLRQEAMKEFVSYAISKNCNFVGGNDLVKKMRELQAKDSLGEEHLYSTAEWEFFQTSGSTTNTQSFVGNINGAKVNMAASEDWTGYECFEGAGYYDSIDHIEVTYQTTAPLRLVLVMKDGYDKNWQVLLNNVGPTVNSGKIPFNSFYYFPDDTGTFKTLNKSKIEGIAIQIAAPNLTASKEISFTVKDIKLYGATLITGITTLNTINKSGAVQLRSMTSSNLKLSYSASDSKNALYSINILSANGRVIESYSNIKLNKGVNNLRLNNLSKGVYFISVKSNKLHKVMQTSII